MLVVLVERKLEILRNKREALEAEEREQVGLVSIINL
jgi:hypothetical protein